MVSLNNQCQTHSLTLHTYMVEEPLSNQQKFAPIKSPQAVIIQNLNIQSTTELGSCRFTAVCNGLLNVQFWQQLHCISTYTRILKENLNQKDITGAFQVY